MNEKIILLEQLTDLRQKGLLSEDEFQDQKRSILMDLGVSGDNRVSHEPPEEEWNEPASPHADSIGVKVNDYLGERTALSYVWKLAAVVGVALLLVGGALTIGRQPKPNYDSPRNAANVEQTEAAQLFWDGQPIDVIGSDACANQYKNIAGSATQQMMAGPNWKQGGPAPDMDRVMASNGLENVLVRRGGQCEVAFEVNAMIDGTRYNWRASCPFYPSSSEPDLVLMLKLSECDWF